MSILAIVGIAAIGIIMALAGFGVGFFYGLMIDTQAARDIRSNAAGMNHEEFKEWLYANDKRGYPGRQRTTDDISSEHSRKRRGSTPDRAR